MLPWGRGRKFLTKTNLIYKAVQMPRKEDKGGNNAEKDLPSKCRYTEPPKVETARQQKAFLSPYHKSSGKYQKIAVYHGRRINSVERQAYKD